MVRPIGAAFCCLGIRFREARFSTSRGVTIAKVANVESAAGTVGQLHLHLRGMIRPLVGPGFLGAVDAGHTKPTAIACHTRAPYGRLT
jgi:hypothetical protein